MSDDNPKYTLEELLVLCDSTLKLTKEDKLWLGTPGDEEAKRTHLEDLLEDAEDLEAALEALAEGGQNKTLAELRKDLGLEDCYKGHSEEVRQERDRWDNDNCLQRAIEVFASQEKAQRWMKKPCRALGGKIPEQLMETPEGVEAVLDELTRIEHGVYY